MKVKQTSLDLLATKSAGRKGLNREHFEKVKVKTISLGSSAIEWAGSIGKYFEKVTVKITFFDTSAIRWGKIQSTLGAFSSDF